MMKQSLKEKLDRAFNPRTVAVVGDKQAIGYMWLNSLRNFRGKLYSVQVDPRELPGIAALGVENYQSLLDIPGPIDYVISSVPRAVAPRVLKDCIQKQVGAISFFTSGFAETATEEGVKLQKVITDMAREADMAIIGPNCMGIHNPAPGLCFVPDQISNEAGPVGFISQSGTHATFFTTVGPKHGIRISKAVSYGNAAILDSSDYLEYLGHDEATKIIGLYVEGVRNGQRFLDCLKDVTRRKPVLIWKGGQTPAGTRATSSHTGSLAESPIVWQAIFKQHGVIEVNNLEEMIDAVKALLYTKPGAGNRVGLISMSGGQSVVITDTFAKQGFEVPLLDQKSYQRLSSFFNTIGGSYNNPFDISSNFLGGADPAPVLRNMLEVMDEDRNIDCIIFEYSAGSLRRDPARVAAAMETLGSFRERSAKPFLAIVTTGSEEELEMEMRHRLIARNIASYPTFERAAKALRKLVDYYRVHRVD